MNKDKIAKLEEKQAELQRKQYEIKAKIRLIKSKEQAEKRKKSTHYKILLGAFWLNEIVHNPQIDVDTDFPKLRKFINDDKKFNELAGFVKEEILKNK